MQKQKQQDELMVRFQEKLEKIQRLKREKSEQSNQQTIASVDRARPPALDSLNEKSRQFPEKKTDLSLVKYHAQELLKFLEQEPTNPMYVRAYIEVRTILNSLPLRDIEANPPSDK